MIAFRVEQWRAWAPGLDNPSAWRAWAQAPVAVVEQEESPACEFLPAMQLRRLSRLARMTMEVASPLCGKDEQLPFVFASRHGETTRTLALLGDVTDEQPLSPTQFGLSVHNAIAGQWSILRDQHAASVAIAGEADTFEHAVVEAAGLLADGAPTVLLAIAEEKPPSAYRPWIHDVPFSYALALRLGRAGLPSQTPDETSWQLQLNRHEQTGSDCAWPHALDFLRAMHNGQPSLQHAWKLRRWQWQRQP